MPAPALLRRVEYVFWATGALLCGLTCGALVESLLFQAAANRRLEREIRAPAPRSPHRTPAAGELVGRLEIPRLKLSAIVLEGSDSRTLQLGVGRVPETAEPGEKGNVVLSGHRDTFFRPLRTIATGDRIDMVTPQGRYGYVVEWTAVVDSNNTGPLKATAGRSLTLVTCYPFRYVGPAPQRFIVRARQRETQ